MLISELNHAASASAVYASSSALPHSHARLASGWWLAFAGRVSNPLDPYKRFRSFTSDILLFRIYPGATECKTSRAEFGQIAVAFSIVDILRYVADWGSDTLVIREFKNPDEAHAHAILLWVLRIRVGTSILATFLSFSAICLFSPDIPPSQKLLIATMAGKSLWVTTGVNWL